MTVSLPTAPPVFLDWSWREFEPVYAELNARPLTAANVGRWLSDWSDVSRRVAEMRERRYVAMTVNTADAEAERRYRQFFDEIFPASEAAEQRLKARLLASGLQPEGLAVPLRNLRAEADLFREANLPLLSDEKKLGNEFDKLIGAQTVQWEGTELTILQLTARLSESDRATREALWRAARSRQLADREALNELWQRFFELRRQIAANAGKASYRDYAWQSRLRFDYTPENCFEFHAAIESVVVPAAERLLDRRRRQLGLDRLRPWDLSDGWWTRPVDPPGLAPLRPFTNPAELTTRAAAVFHRVHPQLGAYFDEMAANGLLDLDNRKHKAPGGYCTSFDYSRQPFIFTNAVGVHDDVQTMLHEGGHAFHVFETRNLPYYPQLTVGLEFAEVASMAMELLSAPYLGPQPDGFYSEKEAARAHAEHLENLLLFWPFMAVVDAFQHWAYLHPQAALDPAQCDAQWTALWRRFMRGVDWSGLDDELATGWQRKAHIFDSPFYYIEYGLAQLGAVQVWRNALKDQAGAVAAYRRALALGGTLPLPQLFAAAGARFAFDAQTLRDAVSLIEATLEDLEARRA
jgi:oligoendopeptidase F